jgi:twitching motility protein PilT
MARVNSLLSIVIDQNANELRLASDREPRMFAYGAPKKLSIPKLSDETLREFLGEILSPEADASVRAGQRVELSYDAGMLGAFHVTLTAHEGTGLSAAFIRGAGPAPSVAAARAPSAQQLPAAEERAASASRVPVAAPIVSAAASTASVVEPSAIAPTQKLYELVARASEMRASDLHLADGEVPTVRVDGMLRALDGEGPADVPAMLGLSGGAKSIDMGADVAGVGRIRVHTYATSEGYAAAIRILSPTAPSFAELNMPFAFDDVVMLPHGLVLVCGATGSGKSTTLAALAQEALRRRSVVLVTLEDPIEYRLTATEKSLVRRRQIGRDAPNFASGLRDALREDPDVLLVGEMRDPETIALALTAAETGHLVLASIHSRSAASAIERIIDSYPPERQTQIRVQLADALRAVVSQRLLPRARGHGRVPAIEVLRATRAVGSLIREGKTAQLLGTIQSSRREGMMSLERSLADRVNAGDIRAEDARAAANDPESLAQYLSRKTGD